MRGFVQGLRAGRQFRVTAPLVIVAAGLLGAPAPGMAATPVDGGAFTLYPVPIHVGAGDQYDPHASGDVVSYTFGLTSSPLHFYDFFTGLDDAVTSSGLGTVGLVAPFIPVIPGTNTYLDELW